MLKLTQWNCQSVGNKRPELEFRAQDSDIWLLSETWLRKGDRINIRNFDCKRRDRSLGRGGGVAILIKNNIEYSQVDITYNCNNKLECCAIQITWNQKPLIIISVYKPPVVIIYC